MADRRQRFCGVVFGVGASSIAIFGALALGAASAADRSAGKVKSLSVRWTLGARITGQMVELE